MSVKYLGSPSLIFIELFFFFFFLFAYAYREFVTDFFKKPYKELSTGNCLASGVALSSRIHTFSIDDKVKVVTHSWENYES